MLVKVRFETGKIGIPHKHHHSQITHVESGVFEVEINGDKQILKKGDAYYIPPIPCTAPFVWPKWSVDRCVQPGEEDFIK